jgi:hypothetical protein
MNRHSMRIEPAQVHPDHRFAQRHIGTVHLSRGFFTLGFALAVLAGSALFTGATGALQATEAVTADAPSGAVAERTQPVDQVNAEDVRNVVLSEAPVHSRNSADSAAKPLQ